MKTYWRVKSWNFTASGMTFTPSADPPDNPFSTNVGGIESGAYFNDIYTTENQLVCGGGFWLNDSDSDQYALIEFGIVKKVGDLYNAGLFGYIYDNIESGIEFGFGTPVANGQAVSTLSFCGGSIPIGASRLGGGEPSEVVSFTASLTPASYWSYGGTYDTTTGEPL
jgi:hypothetical protein